MKDDDKAGPPNWLKSHLAAIGSAAVISVYAAGYARTSAAAARVAGDRPPQRRPVARAPIAPAEIEQRPAPRAPTEKQLAAAVPAVTRDLSTAAKEPSNGDTPKSGTPNAETANAARTDTGTTAAPAAASVAPALDTAPTQPAAKTLSADSAMHAPLKDGVYAGWGTSRHGDIEATVDVKDGRIVSATITQCLTRYSCSWISALPPQVIERQSAEVDYVSGATESSNAFYGAVAQALGKAK